MKICVCGWYYYPGFYRELKKVKDLYSVYVVCNRESDEVNGLQHTIRENVGLDWGAYNYYLKNVWDRRSPVLFMQDDSKVDGMYVFMQIEGIQKHEDKDVVFLFENGVEAARNSNAHGRAFYCTPRFLSAILEDGSFPYDEGNCGFVARGSYKSEKPPEGCKHHNYGIWQFISQIQRINRVKKYNPRSVMTFSGLRLGRRGKL
jgi:hypothetical protein